MVTGFSDQGRYCNEHSKLIDRNPGVSRLAVTFQFWSFMNLYIKYLI
jgi:hypothetical protein